MSLLSIWTSNDTLLLQNLTDGFVRGNKDAAKSFDSVDIQDLDTDDIVSLLNREFSNLVNVTMEDATMHIIAVMPCFVDSPTDKISLLLEACKRLEHKITLHILGLSRGIAKILDCGLSDNQLSVNQKISESFLKEESTNPEFGYSYTLIDDYASNGAAIGFSLESLANYIATIEIALSQDYYSILSPALLGAHRNDNLALGISSLSFPKKDTVKQLLGMGFLAALGNVGINNTEVDAQKAAHEAETILADIESRYPQLYDKAIRPLYRDKGMDEGKAVAEASDIINKNLETLNQEIVKLLADQNFSFPEKEAILALILGRDNANLHGMQYEHESTIIDDACEDPINQYVDAYNKYCIDSGLLPTRGEFEALKLKKWNPLEEKFEDSPQNNEALNPLPEIKRLKQQILNTTAFIREKREELEGLQSTLKLRSDAEEIRQIWHKPEGNLRDFEYKEQPLDEKYVPASGLQVKKNVDLRNFFPPVRNQYDLGSCSSFAVSAMYEAMMARAGVGEMEYLSPGFLFYYSNILKGRKNGGSNYHDQLEVLGKHGICLDELYLYDPHDPDRKPSKEAVKNAESHKVLKAKQVVIINSSDKKEALDHNHTQITSALSEGFPVGISLKIFDNFGKEGPFILHPDDSDNLKEEGYHAMVIAGYSEENNFYIVRNSWGQDFGHDGYCYIPASYIDDCEYLDFACIITEITDVSDGNVKDIPSELANFGATEVEIRIAAIRNAIAATRYELKDLQNLYSDYYKYYQKLMLRLSMPNVQNNIRKNAEVAQAQTCLELERKKKEHEDTFVGELSTFKQSLQKYILSVFGITLGIGIVWYYTQSTVMMILFCVFGGLAVLLWLGYKWWVRIKRRELQEQLDAIAVNTRNQKDILLEMQIRFHVAGIWISRFHKLSVELGKVYDRLVSFNDTLRQWQKEYSDTISSIDASNGNMQRILDPSPMLKEFFANNRAAIVNRIDLLSVFNDYQANIDDLDTSRQRLVEIVSGAIDSLMADFNIVNFLLGDEFPYLPPVDLQEEIDYMIRIGQPTYRNKERNASTPVRLLMGKVENSRSSQWQNTISPYFPLRPVILKLDDPTMIILITLHPQTI